MLAFGWSCMFAPTAGMSFLTVMPAAWSTFLGPRPLSWSSWGVKIEPAAMMTSRFA